MSPVSAFSRPIDPASIPEGGTERHLVADEEERREIAREFGLLELSALSAELALRHWRREGVEVKGRLRAELTQSCVVTLEPVVQVIDEPFEVRLVPAGSRLAGPEAQKHGEIAVDPTAEDPPDVYSGHFIDLGAIVEEHLALFIDPYPRAPGAELAQAFDTEQDKGEERESPFAELARLARKGQEKKT